MLDPFSNVEEKEAFVLKNGTIEPRAPKPFSKVKARKVRVLKNGAIEIVKVPPWQHMRLVVKDAKVERKGWKEMFYKNKPKSKTKVFACLVVGVFLVFFFTLMLLNNLIPNLWDSKLTSNQGEREDNLVLSNGSTGNYKPILEKYYTSVDQRTKMKTKETLNIEISETNNEDNKYSSLQLLQNSSVQKSGLTTKKNFSSETNEENKDTGGDPVGSKGELWENVSVNNGFLTLCNRNHCTPNNSLDQGPTEDDEVIRFEENEEKRKSAEKRIQQILVQRFPCFYLDDSVATCLIQQPFVVEFFQ